MYAASLLQRGLVGPAAVPATKASLLRELDRDLRLVEHESTKLRKKQAELDEEEKEIDAKLKYLELGITQRKESLAKDRGGRDYPPLRGLSEHRDYLSDSELNQLRLQGCATPAGQYAEFPVTAAAPATPSGSAAFQPPRFPPPAPLYPAGSTGPTQNGFAAHQAPTYLLHNLVWVYLLDIFLLLPRRINQVTFLETWALKLSVTNPQEFLISIT